MKSRIASLIGCILLVCSALSSAYAQSKVVAGKVTDQNGKVLDGVTVVVRQTNRATSTDQGGVFSISASPGETLVFTMVGYNSNEVLVGNSSFITVTLIQKLSNLEEVVVVGYGTQKKGNLTGAVSTVDIDKSLHGRPIADVGRGLQGAASGLSVVIPSGEVGSDPIIKIRGQLTSFRGASSPLILLDNVEIPSIQIVNPNDIASITVLKDAAAASIYGAKASNGVILITTKKGSGTAKPQINYSDNFSWQNVWKELKMGDVNALRYTVDAVERIGITTPTGAFYYVDKASYLKAVEWKNKYGSSIGADDPTVFGRDWYVQGATNQKMGMRTYDPYDYMVKEWAPTQQHDLTIGQTVGKTSYNIGLGLLNQSGMIKPAKKDEFTRHNASIRLSSEINKLITIRGGAIYSSRNKEYPYVTNSTTADPWLYLYRWGPLYPFGNDGNGDPIRSPVSEAAAANTANILQNYMNVTLGTTLNFTSNWKFDFDYTYSNQNQIWRRPGTRYTARNSWAAPKSRVDANGQQIYVDSTGVEVPVGSPGAFKAYDLSYDTYTSAGANPDHLYRQVSDFTSSTINAYTTYNLDLKEDHNLKFILGLNRVAQENEWQSQQVSQLTDINNPQFDFAVGAPPVVGGDKTWESQLGYFGRVNYAFRNKYLIEGNLRYDGSSKFRSDLWWRWYPSFSAGWVISQEKFMEWTNPVLSFFKIRGSWGSIGDQTVPNTLYLPLMGSGLSTWIGSNGQKVPFVSTPPAIVNDITWQDIETKNLGVDLSFLRNKINLTFDLFQRNTNNMIVPLEGIPLTFGVGAPQGNFGSLQTNGWELTLDLNHRFDNGVGINFRGNISDAKTRIKEYGSSSQVNANYNGKDIGEIWGYRTDRLYQMEDFELDGNGSLQLITLTANEVPAKYVGKRAYKLKSGANGEKPVYQVFLQNSANFFFGPGDVKFRDLNADGVIDNGGTSLSDHGDWEVIGNSTPRYEYGIRLGADFRGVDFSVFFQGVGNRSIWGDGFLAIPGYNSADGAMPAAIADNYWRPDHTDAFYPAAYNNGGSATSNNMQVQDRYLLNMSYLRLKNLSVGYSLPQSILNRISVNSLRIYGALENFITWDHLGGLPIDPESINGYSMWNTSNYNLGRTGIGIPTFKSVSFGIQLNF
ncbi:MAG TPA: SusC/RagA family TonB-linked outer membrane protein [Niabella sp.]|nr:SusC/RagA family TonB-linked outer membrane protein [Niabella sp.]HQW14860.1 SusC/RagA family TonB-linked outer membrane protein [Niabella sp.]HQX18515.1 SusC/RagA family TonB-linked outer membrane protein [Niabella sp.]HQX41834.1 SusC/RagA family TonB-linked outer membrane protein [Niabella sp.]HRB06042.1 SusC/RagA family TonB-linked outer membrane protein [Niabella sp.]